MIGCSFLLPSCRCADKGAAGAGGGLYEAVCTSVPCGCSSTVPYRAEWLSTEVFHSVENLHACDFMEAVSSLLSVKNQGAAGKFL